MSKKDGGPAFPRYVKDMTDTELAELMRRSKGRIIETTVPQGYLAITCERGEWAEEELKRIREDALLAARENGDG